MPLTGLFLLDPSGVLKLQGATLRGLLSEQGHESLYKRIESGLEGADEVQPALVRDIEVLLDKGPPSKLRDDFLLALRGDESAISRVEAMGFWECFAMGAAGENVSLSPRWNFIFAIERACVGPTRLILQNQFAQAADALAADPLMQMFLWPEALSILRRLRCRQQLAPLQRSVALEVTLSVIAAWDAERPESTNPSRFNCLLPETEGRSNPTSLLFRWIKRQAGVRSISELRKRAGLARYSGLDETTLKRWSCGSHYPQPSVLKLLAKGVFGDADYEPLWSRYWASRQLSLLGHLTERYQHAAAVEATSHSRSLAPWPDLPFGCSSFEAWCHERYPAWMEYHRTRQ